MSVADESLAGTLAPVDPAAPDAPSALRARVAAGLERHGRGGDASGASDASARAAACLTAGEALLGDVLQQPERSRGAALDLLAADALVTYAFELLAAEPERLEAVAGAAMRRIAAHGDVPAS